MKNIQGFLFFFVDEGIDSGPIIVQEKVEIGDMTQEELIIHTKKIGMDSIIKSINLIESNSVVLIENNAEEMTYYSFPTREDVKVFRQRGKRFF
jgi:methionyl-tRNA formyltransferase